MFVSVNTESGEVQEQGQPGRRGVVEQKPEQSAGRHEVGIGGQKVITEIRNGESTTRVIKTGMTADSATVATARDGGSVSQITSLDSLVEDVSGDRIPARVALQMGWLRANGNGYEATDLGREYLPGFPVAASKPVEDQAASSNTSNTTNTADTIEPADPAMTRSEDTTKFLGEAAEQIGEVRMQAYVDALIDQRPDLADKVLADVAGTLGENAPVRVQAVQAELVSKAEALATSMGVDDLEAWGTFLRSDPKAYRAAVEDALNGRTSKIKAATERYLNSDARWSGVDVDPIQHIYIDNKRVEGRVVRGESGKLMVEIAGKRYPLSDQTVRRI